MKLMWRGNRWIGFIFFFFWERKRYCLFIYYLKDGKEKEKVSFFIKIMLLYLKFGSWDERACVCMCLFV